MKKYGICKKECGKKKRKRKGICLCLLAAALLLSACAGTEGERTEAGDPKAETAAVPDAADMSGQDKENQTGAADRNGKEQENQTEAEAQEELSVLEIYDLITESVSLISPVRMQDNFIKNYYNIDPAMLEEYVFSMSEEAVSAETVVIMKLKDKADAETVSGALQLVIEEKSGEMENYLPEQYEIVKKSAVKTNGSYVYLVISEQADAIEQIIEAQL